MLQSFYSAFSVAGKFVCCVIPFCRRSMWTQEISDRSSIDILKSERPAKGLLILNRKDEQNPSIDIENDVHTMAKENILVRITPAQVLPHISGCGCFVCDSDEKETILIRVDNHKGVYTHTHNSLQCSLHVYAYALLLGAIEFEVCNARHPVKMWCVHTSDPLRMHIKRTINTPFLLLLLSRMRNPY